jgi:hypothetical protein
MGASVIYELRDIEKAVSGLYRNFEPQGDGYSNPELRDVWGAFYKDLLKHEALPLPDIGYAYLLDSTVETKGYWDEGNMFFVFRITSANQPERIFRMNGYHSSYDGRVFDGHVEEVEGRQVVKYEWSTK